VWTALPSGSRIVDADAARGGVEMELSGAALAAEFADQVPLARTALADFQPFYQRTLGDDFASEFMARHQPDRHGARGPVVPVPDVDVGAADAGLVNLDQHILGADLGHRAGFGPQADLGFRFDQSFHARAPVSRPAASKAASA
jgi:hypothetical protein